MTPKHTEYQGRDVSAVGGLWTLTPMWTLWTGGDSIQGGRNGGEPAHSAHNGLDNVASTVAAMAEAVMGHVAHSAHSPCFATTQIRTTSDPSWTATRDRGHFCRPQVRLPSDANRGVRAPRNRPPEISGSRLGSLPDHRISSADPTAVTAPGP